MFGELSFISVHASAFFPAFYQVSKLIAYYVMDEARMNDDHEPILRYYCTYHSRAKALGTCAHVASLLWLLGQTSTTYSIPFFDDGKEKVS